MEHIFKLKQILHERNNSEVFIGVCLACIKGLLLYSKNQLSTPLRLIFAIMYAKNKGQFFDNLTAYGLSDINQFTG